MASTDPDGSGKQVTHAAYARRFTATASAVEPMSDETEPGGAPGTAGVLMSRRAVISGVTMVVAALLCFVLAAGFSGNGTALSAETAQKVTVLREQIQLVKAKADALPAPNDADRGLVTAQASASQIAKLQNDYRYLAPQVAAAGGRLGADATAPTRRNLAPYFAPSVDRSVLAPWYLLASDKDVPRGVGIPMGFDSGLRWVPQRPYTISDDSIVRVTWLAVETRPAAGQTAAVFAWTRADFDLTRRTFSNVQTGTSTRGEALRLEVKPA